MTEGPRIVPALDQLSVLPTPLNAGEWATIGAMTALGPDWRVFVQPRIAMAQPDFVVMHPDHGVWVIEVKDWDPALYRPLGPVGARWLEVQSGDGWVRRVSPRVQVAAYERTFRERFFVDWIEGAPVRPGLNVLLVLPQFSRDEAEALLGRFPLIAGEELGFLAETLQAHRGTKLPEDRLAELTRWLDEPETISDQRRSLVLSNRAQEVARNPGGVTIRRVRGPAGSGKSLALASRAIALAGQGKKVLIVTFNITLGHYVNDLCSRASRQQGVPLWNRAVSFTHFHGMLSELTQQLGRVGWDGDEPWEGPAIRFLSRAYSSPGHELPTFDAILVDEGQDFEGEWWQFLRTHVLRPGGEMLLVADRTQNLFQRSNWTESGTEGGGFRGPWFELKGTYRTPVDLVPIVAEYAQRYLPDEGRDIPSIEADHPTLGDAHKPTHRRWVNVADVDAIEAAADEVIRLMEDVEGLSPSDIVVLADHDVGVQVIEELQARGNDVHSLFTHNDGETRKRRKRGFWAGTPGIKGSTVHSYKGWESRAVVCVPSVMGETALYIAMTRVKAAPSRPAYLTVVNAVDSLREFKPRFEREILPSEVPALGGQVTFDV